MTAKQAEIETLRTFIASIPSNSYLADYMEGSLVHFTHMVECDLCDSLPGHIARLEVEAAETRMVLEDLNKKVAEAKEALRNSEIQIIRNKRAIKEMYDAGQKIIEAGYAVRQMAEKAA